MKKCFIRTFVLVLALIGFTLFSGGTLFAEEDSEEKEVSESTLNEWLKESGAPSQVIERWSYDQKLSLYEEGDEVEYVTSEVVDLYKNEDGEFLTLNELKEEQETDGDFSTMATIPESDLKVSHDIWRTYDGSSEERYTFYANYEWQTTSTRSFFNGSVENDKVGIALPSGWDIVAGSDECKEFQSGIGPGMGNGTSQHGNCNGGLYDANFYGYAWSLTGDDDVWHSGWVSLKAARTSSSANIEAISQYAQAAGTSTSFGVNWGPLSLSFTSSSDIDKRTWHTEK
ncbi:hypothetical protein [Halobacillus andaensis]|uniref:hypothetical protein n=1 Tax=Halobacillus andaensis TaxID=1176239 RepID=UPI003D70EECD